jgi:hypothetical protein
MIGEDHDRFNRKWTLAASRAERASKRAKWSTAFERRSASVTVKK